MLETLVNKSLMKVHVPAYTKTYKPVSKLKHVRKLNLGITIDSRLINTLTIFAYPVIITSPQIPQEHHSGHWQIYRTSFLISLLDHYTGILDGLPKCSLNRLQRTIQHNLSPDRFLNDSPGVTLATCF